jgi:hypothetical protein
MLYGVEVELVVFCLGMLVGVGVVRYGIGLGSRLHVRARADRAIDDNTDDQIDQEFTQ